MQLMNLEVKVNHHRSDEFLTSTAVISPPPPPHPSCVLFLVALWIWMGKFESYLYFEKLEHAEHFSWSRIWCMRKSFSDINFTRNITVILWYLKYIIIIVIDSMSLGWKSCARFGVISLSQVYHERRKSCTTFEKISWDIALTIFIAF